MKIVKARKNHICDHCSDIIRKGELYIYESGREADFDDEYNQCGVIFWKSRRHNRECMDKISWKPEPKNYLKNCTRCKYINYECW